MSFIFLFFLVSFLEEGTKTAKFGIFEGSYAAT